MGRTGSRIPGFSLNSGQPMAIGPAELMWDPIDVNAEHLKIDLPPGSATQVPVFNVGVAINDIDVGLYDGETFPTIVTTDLDLDSGWGMGWVADDRPAVKFYGSAGALEIIRAGNPLVVQNTTVQADNQGFVIRGPDQAGAEAIGDELYLSFEQDTADGIIETVRLTSEILSPATSTVDARFKIGVLSNNALITMFQIDSSVAGVLTTTIPAGDIILNDGVSIRFGTAGAQSDLESNGTNTVWDFLLGTFIIDFASSTDVIFSANLVDLVDGTILEVNELIRWDTTGAAITAGGYQVGRDDGNVMHLNVPTGSTFELSVNDVAQLTLSATALNLLDNSITTTGGGSLTGTWTDLGSVTTIDINGGTIDSLTALSIRSTGASFDLTFATATVFTAGRILTFDPGDSARTITLSGNPTLADWFDQDVKTTANPTFVNLTITSFAANWTNASRTVADLGSITTVDINGGNIDGTAIGASATSTIIGTTIDATTDFTIGATVITDGVITDAGGLQIAAAVDLANNTLSNVANAENVWNASGIIHARNNATRIQVRAYNVGAANTAEIRMAHSMNGTVGSHTAMAAGDILGDLVWQGSDGSGFEEGARIRVDATETWSGSARGTRLEFYTVDNTTTTLDLRWTIDEDGSFLHGSGPGIDLNSSGTLLNIGATGNNFGATQLDLAASFNIVGANQLDIGTTLGSLVLNPLGVSIITLRGEVSAVSGGLNAVAIGSSAITLANSASARYTQLFLGAGSSDSVTLQGTEPVTSHMYQMSISGQSLERTFGSVTINNWSALIFQGNVGRASTGVTINDAAAIYLDAVASITGTVIRRHGIYSATSTLATANYHLTLGSTDVDQNLIHIGNTEDALFWWDDSETAFAFDEGVSIGGILKQNVTSTSLVVAGGVAFTDVLNAWIDDATHGAGTVTHYIGNETIDTTASDVRLKTNWSTPNGLSKEHLIILADSLEEYDYLPGNLGGQRFVGFGAQHLHKVLPQYVNVAEGDNNWSVNYKYMVGPLIKGWSEHEIRFSTVEDRVGALEEAQDILRAQVVALGGTPEN